MTLQVYRKNEQQHFVRKTGQHLEEQGYGPANDPSNFKKWLCSGKFCKMTAVNGLLICMG